MIVTILYLFNSFAVSFLAYNTYKNSKISNFHDELTFIAKFFKYTAMYVVTIVAVSFLAPVIANPTFTFLILIPRIFLIIAFIHLLRTPIFSRFEFIKKRLKLLDFLLWMSIILAIVITYFDFNYVEVINGNIVSNLNFFAAQFLSFPPLTLGIVAVYSFIKFNRDKLKKQLIKNIYLLGFGALLLGIGEALFIFAQNASMSLFGASINALGYAMLVFVAIMNDFRKSKHA